MVFHKLVLLKAMASTSIQQMMKRTMMERKILLILKILWGKLLQRKMGVVEILDASLRNDAHKTTKKWLKTVLVTRADHSDDWWSYLPKTTIATRPSELWCKRFRYNNLDFHGFC